MTVTSAIDLQSQKPDEVLSWLADIQSGRTHLNVVPDDQVNWWLALTEVAKSRARKAVADRLLWLQVVKTVYGYLGSVTGKADSDSNEQSFYMFLVSIIREHGAVLEQPLLDPKVIEEWFFNRLSFSSDKVVSLLKDKGWRNLPLAQIAELRQLKNRLSVLEQLREAGYLSDNIELSRWLDLKSSLP